MIKVPVTVLMPVYDPPLAMLEQAVGSVLRQTFTDFEFLILDDGGICEAVRSYLDGLPSRDSRVLVHHELHRGVPATLNRGLALSRGEFIARQDSDDWSEPQRLTRQVEFLTLHPGVSLVSSDTYSHRADGSPLWRLRLPHTSDDLARALWHGNPFVHGSTMYRRQSALAIGGYRAQLPGSADYDFLWRLTETGSAINLAEVLYHYRYATGSVSARRTVDQTRSYRAAYLLARARRQGEQEDIPAALAAAAASLPDALRAALKQADHFMLAGDFTRARNTYWRLLLENPGSALAWGKMVRLLLFCGIPPIRESCFRLVRATRPPSGPHELQEFAGI